MHHIEKSLESFNFFKKDPLHFMADGYRKWGAFFELRALHKRFGIVSSPKIADAIFNDSDGNYLRGSPTVKALIGDAMLSQIGTEWKQKRSLSQPFFHPKEINKTREVIAEIVDSSISSWKTFDDEWVVEMSSLFQRLTLSVVCKAFLKKDLGQLDHQVIDAIDTLFEIVKTFITNPFRPPLWVPTTNNRLFKACMDQVYDVVQDLVVQSDGKVDERILIDRLIHAVDQETGYSFTNADLKNEVIQYFFAGHETTANLMTFLFDYLAHNPKVQTKIREEVLNLKGGTPSLGDFSKMTMLNYAIQETLRLRPSAWTITRTATKNHILRFDGGEIPVGKGTMIFVSVWNIQHDDKYWDDPNEFVPERMANMQKQTPNTYLPFGIGKTSCIGNNFAFLEAALITSRILKEFEVFPVKDRIVEYHPGITLRNKGDLNLRVKKLSPQNS